MSLVFVKPAGLRFNGQYVSDHNRSELQIAFERLESRHRTQLGTMRKYYRADRRSISCSWDNLPETSEDTVDGFMGAKDMESFFLAQTGVVSVEVAFDTGVTEQYQMVFTDFNSDLVQRRGVPLFNVSITLEEV